MEVKTKALAAVSGLVLALSGIGVTYGVRLHDRQIEESIRAEESTIDATVGDLERFSYAPYRARLANVIEEHPGLAQAFAGRDRDGLYRLCLPLFRRRQLENPFLHAWDFNLPDGTVFLRIQDPAAFGDDISRTRGMIRAVHERREPVAGYDVGRHGALYWIARPVFHEGRYVGATELGIAVDQLREALERRFGTPVALTVKSSAWEKAIRAGSGYPRHGDEVLIAPADSRYRQLPADAVFSGGKDRRVRLGGADFVLHNCAILRDHLGKPVGSLLVLQEITARLAHRRRFVIGAVLVSGTLLALTLAALSTGFGSLLGRLERSAADAGRARAEVERANSELELRVGRRTAELQEANLTLAREAGERIEMARALEDSHARLLRVLDGLDAVVYVADLESHEVLFANQAARESFGDLVGKKCWETVQSGQSGPCSFCNSRSLCDAGGQPAGVATWEFRSDALGRWFAVRERAIPWADNRLVRLAIATDVTARKADEERIRASLREKELLLKEVHHRVKNNLQIISSLLRLQAAGGEKAGAELFLDSQSRIRAMSLIHEKLFQSADLDRIDMSDYLGSLVGNLAVTYGTAAARVGTAVDADRLQLDIDTAVLCGLIVNELVSNSLKHAFPDGRRGEVRVTLSRQGAGEEGAYRIVVQDDGIGLPEAVAAAEPKTLGLRLVGMLARDQLQGDVEVSREGGTRTTVRFRALKYGSRT